MSVFVSSLSTGMTNKMSSEVLDNWCVCAGSLSCGLLRCQLAVNPEQSRWNSSRQHLDVQTFNSHLQLDGARWSYFIFFLLSTNPVKGPTTCWSVSQSEEMILTWDCVFPRWLWMRMISSTSCCCNSFSSPCVCAGGAGDSHSETHRASPRLKAARRLRKQEIPVSTFVRLLQLQVLNRPHAELMCSH